MKRVYFLLTIFCVSLVVRIIFFNLFLRDNPVQLRFDSGHYHRVAVTMVQGKGYSSDDGFPYFYRLPGYPFFLALCYKIFGMHSLWALITQLILASLIPILIFFFVLTCLPHQVVLAKTAAILSTFHVGFLIFAGLVMSETFFILFFLLFLIFFMRVLWHKSENDSAKLRDMAMAGFCLGISSLIRPIGMMPILGACIIFMAVQQWSLKKFVILGSFVATWALPIGAWIVRNFLLTGIPFLTTFSGPHLINHGVVRIIMNAQNCSWVGAQEKVYQELKQQHCVNDANNAHSEIRTSHASERYALRMFKKYPLHTIKLCLINMCKTICSLYSAELLFIDSGGQLPPYTNNRGLGDLLKRFLHPMVNNPWIVVVIYYEIFMHLLMLIGCFGACVLMLQQPQYYKLLCVSLSFIIMFVVLSCFCGFARLRLPIEPFFIMLSLIFWMHILERVRIAWRESKKRH